MASKRSRDDDDDGESVVLGVDGGGTSTRCICMLVKSSDGVVGSASGESSNRHSVGEEKALQTLKQVLEEAFRQSKREISALKAVCVGIAGLDGEKEKESMLTWLRNLYPQHVKLLVYNDTLPALASANLEELFGCVLIAGTGAIAYGRTKNKKEARADGWGPLMGDCGSGYWLSVQALNAVMKAYDGRGEGTMLTKSILDLVELKSADELSSWAYSDTSRSHIAKLAPLVFTCAKDGDEAAQMILTNASLELSETVKSVVRRLSLCGDDGKSPFPLVLAGRVLSVREEWDLGLMVAEHVKETYIAAEVIRPEVAPVYGAAWLARRELDTNGPKRPTVT